MRKLTLREVFPGADNRELREELRRYCRVSPEFAIEALQAALNVHGIFSVKPSDFVIGHR